MKRKFISLGAGTWTQKADMPTARFKAGSAVVDRKIYVIGGYDQVALSAVEEYDPATDTWTRRADIPTVRGGLVAAAVDGIIYAITGETKLDGTFVVAGTVEAYDPATDTWTRKADIPTARRDSTAAVVDGIIYVIGGSRGQTVLPAVEAYDPATDTWTKKADIPTARYVLAACVIDGRIYVSGGATKWDSVNSLVPTVEVYDPATDSWIQAFDMPRVGGAHTASVVAGKIYIIGGGDPGASRPGITINVYDPATDTWTTAANFPSPRGTHTAGVVDGKIYTIGGVHAPRTPPISTVYEFDPGLPDANPGVR